MVKDFNINKFQVEQLEYFADLLEGIHHSKDNVEAKFLIFILNIESLLPTSNIFSYVLKTDEKKEDKFNLETTRKSNYDEIDSLTKQMQDIGERIKELYSDVDDINYTLSDIENYIDESEWKVEMDSHEEVAFNSIKQKLILKKRLNYGNI